MEASSEDARAGMAPADLATPATVQKPGVDKLIAFIILGGALLLYGVLVFALYKLVVFVM
jgi:hypothetical protein